MTKKDFLPRLVQFLKKNPGASIVYATLQKQTEELAANLRAQGFQARAFHAGMDTAVKMQLQDEFMRRDYLVIVATTAFGMGMTNPAFETWSISTFRAVWSHTVRRLVEPEEMENLASAFSTSVGKNFISARCLLVEIPLLANQYVASSKSSLTQQMSVFQ